MLSYMHASSECDVESIYPPPIIVVTVYVCTTLIIFMVVHSYLYQSNTWREVYNRKHPTFLIMVKWILEHCEYSYSSLVKYLCRR